MQETPTGIPAGVSFCIERFSCFTAPLLEEFKAFQINISTNKIDDYEVSYGFYSNGNNECNRNELGRQLINQHDAL